jgi:hypothetical protein
MSTIPSQPTQKGKNCNYGLKMNSSAKSKKLGLFSAEFVPELMMKNAEDFLLCPTVTRTVQSHLRNDGLDAKIMIRGFLTKQECANTQR